MADTEVISARRTSSDIAVMGQEMKQKMDPKNKDQKAKDLRAELDMQEHRNPLPDVVAQFGTDLENGMTSAAAAKRQGEEGKNKLTPPPGVPEWLKFLRTQTGFFSLLLWGGAILCFVGYGLKKEVDNLYLGVVLSGVVLITGIFSYSQERKSDNLMESFKDMMTTETTVIRDGKAETIDAVELVRGDIVRVKSGDKIPADLRVLECSEDMKVDNSSLTGENEPLSRGVNCTHKNPLETKNMAFFGTLCPSGKAKCMVVNVGDNTVMGRIAALASSTETIQSPINKEIEHFVFIVSGVAIFLGVTFFLIGAFLGVDWITNLVFMIGIIVANVPEGLLATVTVCLTLTAKRMHTKSVLVKNLEAVETLGSTTCICSDKTGTLTQNVMTVANLVYDQAIWDCECSISPVRNFQPEDPTFGTLLKVITVANGATFEGKFKKKTVNGVKQDDLNKPVPFEDFITLGDGSKMKAVQWQTNGDASESAMIKFSQRFGDIEERRAQFPKQCELPFNSTNKFMLTINQNGAAGSQILMKGAPERIINRCDKILLNGEIVDYTPEEVAKTEALQLQLSKMGRRVLGCCMLDLSAEDYPADYKYSIENPNFPMGTPRDEVDWNADPAPSDRVCGKMVFVGLTALIDPPRPQVPPAVAKCKTAGIKVVMVTGDHPETAKAIAKEVGIIWGKTKEDVEEDNAARGLNAGDAGWSDPDLAPAIVVPGWTITDINQEEWDDILDHQQIVFARTSPQQKLIIVENFQRRKEVVAVTGDGVNDAPALKKADIGVAMGIMGSDVSKEAADMILIDDNFASIVSGVEEGRLIFDNLKKSIAYTLSSNIPEISPFLAFITIQVPLPLSTILILCVDLGTDMVPAISMAWEKPEADIMRRNPRDASVDRLVTKKLVCFAYLQIGVIQAISGFYAWLTVLNDYGYPPQVLPGLGAFDNWGKQQLFCKVTGGVMRNVAGVGMPYPSTGMYSDVLALQSAGYIFWDPAVATIGSVTTTKGAVSACDFAAKNFLPLDETAAGWTATTYGNFLGYTGGIAQATSDSYTAMHAAGYFEYLPWRSRQSNFWNTNWLSQNAFVASSVPATGPDTWDTLFYSYTSFGFWVPTGSQSTTKALGTSSSLATLANSNTFTTATLQYANSSMDTSIGGLLGSLYGYKDSSNNVMINVASRMMQTEALKHAQTAGFIGIIVVQWADLTICKTRWLSIKDQGMRNPAMNFGLLFETILGAALCYSPANVALGTRPLRLTHWFPAMPFAVIIFSYDEIRKYLMRSTSEVTEDPETKRITRNPGWLERNTYY